MFFSLYGQKERLLDIWPILSESPIVKLFGYSPLIHSAFETNRDLFTSLPFGEPYFPCSEPATSASPITTALATKPPTRCNDPYQPIPGLLALHLRRGDFKDHCAHLAKWSASWMGFNSFPQFPDQWVKPEGGGWGETTDENMALYMRRCYPSVAQIVARVDEIRQHPASRGLKDVYIMTNGDREWVKELKAALRAMGGWDKIASSRDMTITREQKEVAQAVDMMIGEKAQVMVGNGVSVPPVGGPWDIADGLLVVVEYDFEHRHDEDGPGIGTGEQPFLVVTDVSSALLSGSSRRYCCVLPWVASYTYLIRLFFDFLMFTPKR